MEGFISYRFTGETKEDLVALLNPIKDAFEKKGMDVYCNFFDTDLPERSKGFEPQDYVFDAFKTLDSKDFLFVIINSEEKSEGMIMEVGYGVAKGKRVIVAVKDGVKKTYLPGMANKIIRWSDLNDLISQIENLEIDSI